MSLFRCCFLSPSLFPSLLFPIWKAEQQREGKPERVTLANHQFTPRTAVIARLGQDLCSDLPHGLLQLRFLGHMLCFLRYGIWKPNGKQSSWNWLQATGHGGHKWQPNPLHHHTSPCVSFWKWFNIYCWLTSIKLSQERCNSCLSELSWHRCLLIRHSAAISTLSHTR